MIKAINIDDETHFRKTLGMLLKEYCPGSISDVAMQGCPNDDLVGLGERAKFIIQVL